MDVHGPIETRCDTPCPGGVSVSESAMNGLQLAYTSATAKTHNNEYMRWKGLKVRFGKNIEHIKKRTNGDHFKDQRCPL